MHLPRYCDIWLPGYVRSRFSQWTARTLNGGQPRVWVMIADHFEPLRRPASDAAALDSVRQWRRRWPDIASGHVDSDGRHPVYTFFYAEEQYRPHLIDPLAEMTAQGIADVEVHLHHDGEGADDFIERIHRFTTTLFNRHGLLRTDGSHIRFGFIHGNWALGNSLPGGRWCGVNHELRVLRDLGCYADFTMPSGASPTQARTVNRIYWATETTDGRKSYDTGTPLDRGGPAGDLLMIPGPLGLRWRERLKPRMEQGELAGYDMPTLYRVKRWLSIAPRLGNDIFIKLYTHGAQDWNLRPLLDEGLTTLFSALTAECRRRGYELRYASAWQIYRAAMALWQRGDPVQSVRVGRGQPTCAPS